MRAKSVLVALFLLASLQSFAHALWIETDTKGAKGKQHRVNIFFGEFSSGKPDTTAKWFSNMRDIKVYVSMPDGSRQLLSLVQKTDHYTADFMPASNGIYAIAVAHTVADVYGDAKIEYYAAATVNVNAGGFGALSKATALAISPTAEIKPNQSISLQVFNDQTILPAAKVVIDAPGGWSKTLYTDAQGNVSFVPSMSGLYMIEAIRNDKTPGTHNGKTYKTVTHLVTYCIPVKP